MAGIVLRGSGQTTFVVFLFPDAGLGFISVQLRNGQLAEHKEIFTDFDKKWVGLKSMAAPLRGGMKPVVGMERFSLVLPAILHAVYIHYASSLRSG